MKTKIEAVAVIPGFRAVESACAWKVKVAQDTAGLSANETLRFFRAAAKKLQPPGRKQSAAKP